MVQPSKTKGNIEHRGPYTPSGGRFLKHLADLSHTKAPICPMSHRRSSYTQQPGPHKPSVLQAVLFVEESEVNRNKSWGLQSALPTWHHLQRAAHALALQPCRFCHPQKEKDPETQRQ
eukprot:273571-Pelagomonas_calceolata.AAC.2